MSTLLYLLAVIGGFGALAYFAAPLWAWTAGLALAVALASLQLPGFLAAVAWLLWVAVALANIPLVRRYLYSAPLLRLYRHKLPAMSTTEREALDAGNVWWDAELFSGRPEWHRLLELPKPSLTPEEQAFLDGPVDELCRRIDDWQITYELHDLPPELWEFIKARRFLGMIIPKDYGGLGFSAQAHSAVVAKVASRSGSAAVTVMVPNSLGPAELLMHYGTEAQKSYYLPRLAEGREIPCFALTNPYAGSDASAIPDRGVVCQGEYQGQSVLGIRVTWEKRYITLAPVATVLGLAFQLYDPEHLVGTKDNVGITLALIPANHHGVRIGRRHFPLKLAFQNGPTAGEDVFIPMDMVIGGRERLGQGWRMLMQRLTVGRSISLPALAAAAVKYCARYAGALRPGAQAIQAADRPLRGDRGTLGAYRRRGLCGRVGAPDHGRGFGSRPRAGGDFGDPEIPGHRTPTARRQRRHGHPRRPGHLRGAEQLPGQYVSGRAGLHHGRRREYSHPQPHRVRSGRHSLSSLVV